MSWSAIGGMGLFVAMIAMFFGGFYGFYVTKRRAFNRTNRAGVEEFASYGHKVKTRFTEILIRIASLISIGISLILAFAFTR